MADFAEIGRELAALEQGGRTPVGRRWRIRFSASDDGWKVQPVISVRHGGEMQALCDYGFKLLPWAAYSADPRDLVLLAVRCRDEALKAVEEASPPVRPPSAEDRATREYLDALDLAGEHLTAAARAVANQIPPDTSIHAVIDAACRIAAMGAVGAGYDRDSLVETVDYAWSRYAGEIRKGTFEPLRTKLDS